MVFCVCGSINVCTQIAKLHAQISTKVFLGGAGGRFVPGGGGVDPRGVAKNIGTVPKNI